MIRCSVRGCREVTHTVSPDPDWEGWMCDHHWRRTSRITRGWFWLVQSNGDEAGWPERLATEHNILWDILLAQASA